MHSIFLLVLLLLVFAHYSAPDMMGKGLLLLWGEKQFQNDLFCVIQDLNI